MGIFGRKDPADGNGKSQGPNETEAPRLSSDPEETRIALENGGIPPAAARRLHDLSGGHGSSFTSDLSVNEFALLKGTGFHPITQVMGTAVYKIGLQQIPYGRSGIMQVETEAFNEARRLAIGRLQQEASLARADAVVGARISQGIFDAEAGLIEFSLVGTAVKSSQLSELKGSTRKNPDTVLTTLSGQDLYALSEKGYLPVGLVGASSTYLASLGPYTLQQMYSFYGANMVNFEITEFTEGYYANRRLVMHEVEKAAKAMGARGVIDVKFNSHTNSYQIPGSDREVVGAVAFTTHVLATGIIQTSSKAAQGHQLAVFMNQ